MSDFVHTATDLATGLWWLGAYIGVFLLASIFVAGLCKAAARPMPTQDTP